MKKKVLRALLFVVLFVLSALTFNFIGNRGFNTKAVEEEETSIDVAYMSYNGIRLNKLYAFRNETQSAIDRESILPVNEDKTVSLILPNSLIEGRSARYELRDMTGVNLIEEGDLVSGESVSDTETIYSAGIRMDMTLDKEYSLRVILKGDDQNDKYYFYSRIKRINFSRLDSIVAYAEAVSNEILNENARRADEEAAVYQTASSTDAVQTADENDPYSIITKVSGSLDIHDIFSGNEDTAGTFGRVNIRSKFDSIVMDGMKLDKLGNVIPTVGEVSADSAQIRLRYRAASGYGSEVRYFTVNEYYTIGYDSGRDSLFIQNYLRTIDEDFAKFNIDRNIGGVRLGIISDEQPDFMVSDTARQIVFVKDSGLWLYNAAEGDYAKIYGSEVGMTLKDEGYRIKLLDIGEDYIDFIVYGRLASGSHTGMNGIALYEFSFENDSLREVNFISTDTPLEMMKIQSGKYSYYDRSNRFFYTLIADSLVKINVINGNYEELVSNIPTEYIHVSNDHRTIAYPDKVKQEEVETITVLTLCEGKNVKKTVDGEKLHILGFVGNDLVYGAARPEYVKTGADSVASFIYDKLFIIGNGGEIKKKYEVDNVLITDVVFQDENIYLQRASKDEATGDLVQIKPDYISFNSDAFSGKVAVKIQSDSTGIPGVVLKLPQNVYMGTNTDEIIVRTAQGVKQKTEDIKAVKKESLFYIYTPEGLEGICESAGKAISAATENGGFVTDDAGQVLYKMRSTKAFLSIAGSFEYIALAEDNKSLEAGKEACISMCTNKAGGQGTLLNLTGADLDVAIGFLSDGIPFTARLKDRYVVAVSYNSDAIRYYDPVEGEEVRVGRQYFERETTNAGKEFYIVN